MSRSTSPAVLQPLSSSRKRAGTHENETPRTRRRTTNEIGNATLPIASGQIAEPGRCTRLVYNPTTRAALLLDNTSRVVCNHNRGPRSVMSDVLEPGSTGNAGDGPMLGRNEGTIGPHARTESTAPPRADGSGMDIPPPPATQTITRS